MDGVAKTRPVNTAHFNQRRSTTSHFSSNPTEEQHKEILLTLLMVIENMESFYKDVEANPGHDSNIKPYDLMNTIYEEIKSIPPSDIDMNRREKARKKIIASWEKIRDAITSEFDRGKQRRIEESGQDKGVVA